MSIESAAQLAFEAYRRAEASALRSPEAQKMALAGKGWETLSGDERVWWMITAAAVETDQVRLARQDRDQLRKAALDLAAELEDEAARTYSAALRLLGDPAGPVLEEQAEAKRSTAIRLRKIAEPPA